MFDLFERSINLFGMEVSFGRVFAVFVVILVTLIISIFFNGWITRRLRKDRSRSKKNLLYALKYIINFLIYFTGIVVTLNLLGFGLNWIIASSAALIVGLGLGVQEMVSNYISGISLIFSNWISYGDTLEVEGEFGRVQEIGLRGTRLITPLGRHILVPNSKLLNGLVRNWSSGNHDKKAEVVVGVSYDTDLEKAQELLSQAVAQVKGVSKSFEPMVLCDDFADSSINLRIRFAIGDVFGHVPIESEVRYAIKKALDKHGVTIPFPQRDVHLIK